LGFLTVEFLAKKANMTGHMHVSRVLETILNVVQSKGIKVDESSPHELVGPVEEGEVRSQIFRWRWPLKLLSVVNCSDLDGLRKDLCSRGLGGVRIYLKDG